MNNGFTKSNLLHTAPKVLKNDAGMNPLVDTIAEAISKLGMKVVFPNIYARIDELPEDLLDILAKDFKVDWYDYNWGIEAKRQTIKDSFYVHRHLGTVGAVKTALSDVWPPSTVEEWFEYGGEPYYFRVILDASQSTEPIYVNSALNAIMFYKSARSHLESNIPIVRVTFGILITTDAGNSKYHVRSCGTDPRVATHGNISDEGIVVEDSSPSLKYHNPITGQSVTGTYPNVATHGDMENDGLCIGASASESVYTARPCGTPLTSLS